MGFAQVLLVTSTPNSSYRPVADPDNGRRRRLARGTEPLSADVRQAVAAIEAAASRREILEIAVAMLNVRYREVHVWLVRGHELQAQHVNTSDLVPIMLGGPSSLGTYVERGASLNLTLGSSPADGRIKFRLRDAKVALLTVSNRGLPVCAFTGSRLRAAPLEAGELDAVSKAISWRMEKLDA